MDGQKDGQTDRIAISISRVSVLTRDKKVISQFGHVQVKIQRYSIKCQTANSHVHYTRVLNKIQLWKLLDH